MTVNDKELIDFFDAEYAQDVEADETKKAIREEMKGYAQNNGINPKTLTAAYNLYKKYKAGKQTDVELDELATLTGIVDDYFAS